ncbi:hypothetical protein U1Q18_037304, partial [Sarracenia purpurea var. burkii]
MPPLRRRDDARERRSDDAATPRDDATLRRRVGVGVGVVRLVFPQNLLILKSKDLFRLFGCSITSI